MSKRSNARRYAPNSRRSQAIGAMIEKAQAVPEMSKQPPMVEKIQAHIYQHAEAYNHMRYDCEAGHHTWVWNSRDGVTPFIIRCRYPGCALEAVHHDWGADVKEPGYAPRVGEFIFRDMTHAEIVVTKAQIVAQWEKSPQLDDEMRANGIETPAEYVQFLVREQEEREPGAPILLQVQMP